MIDDDETPAVEEDEPVTPPDVESENTESSPEVKKPVKRKASHVSQAVTGGNKDILRFSTVKVKNKAAKNVLAVYQLQRRLGDLGYNEATSDIAGYYGDLTIASVTKWQTDNKLDATGVLDYDQFVGIFTDDPDVEVTP